VEPLHEEFIDKESVIGSSGLFVGDVCANVADSSFIFCAVSMVFRERFCVPWYYGLTVVLFLQESRCRAISRSA
jgi:hypothetical protein